MRSPEGALCHSGARDVSTLHRGSQGDSQKAPPAEAPDNSTSRCFDFHAALRVHLLAPRTLPAPHPEHEGDEFSQGRYDVKRGRWHEWQACRGPPPHDDGDATSPEPPGQVVQIAGEPCGIVGNADAEPCNRDALLLDGSGEGCKRHVGSQIRRVEPDVGERGRDRERG